MNGRLNIIALVIALASGCMHVSGPFVRSARVVGRDLVLEKCLIEWSHDPLSDTFSVLEDSCRQERRPLPRGVR